MQIKIIFDNKTANKKIRSGWGFACLVDGRILFDTGEKGSYLTANMKAMKTDISKIEAVVISHDHWDHTGGLWDMLKSKKGLMVYGCPGFSKEFKKKVLVSGGKLSEKPSFSEIADGIFVTGEIAGTYGGRFFPEQALILKTDSGITVITGCAHPGVANMVKKVKGKFRDENIHAVLGGFHLSDKTGEEIKNIVEEFKKMGVEKAGPTHCTGEAAERIFETAYGKDFIPVKAGETIDV